MADVERMDAYDLRPARRNDGSGLWDARDWAGFGHVLGLESAREVEIWIAGYDVGAAENM